MVRESGCGRRLKRRWVWLGGRCGEGKCCGREGNVGEEREGGCGWEVGV